ncbi:hypothetical protein CRUP_009752 [Coryphaenoides rupestris]|nr:hypothetical protein CRUP_009752 [Coryphaenoides rupestris]
MVPRMEGWITMWQVAWYRVWRLDHYVARFALVTRRPDSVLSSLAPLRLLVPPLRLFSAVMWEVARQQRTSHFGTLEDFVSLVTDAVPELLSGQQKSLLLLALRARMTQEVLSGDATADPDAVRHHVERVHAVSMETNSSVLKQWASSLLTLCQAVQETPEARKHLLQALLDQDFTAALEGLLCHFLSRLDQSFPVPDFKQAAVWLSAPSAGMEECLQEMDSNREELRDLLSNQTYRLGHAPSPGCSVAEATLGSSVAEATLVCSVAEVTLGSSVAEATLGSSVAEATLVCSVAEVTLGASVAEATLGCYVAEATLVCSVAEETLGSSVAEATLGSSVAVETLGSSVAEVTLGCSVAEEIQGCSDAEETIGFSAGEDHLLTTWSRPGLPPHSPASKPLIQSEPAARQNLKQDDCDSTGSGKESYTEIGQSHTPTKQLTIALKRCDQRLSDSDCCDEDRPESAGGAVSPSGALLPSAPLSHQTDHNNQRLAHKCPQCGQCFIYRSEVLRHLRAAQGCRGPPPRPQVYLSCFQCARSFQTDAALKAHVQEHRCPHQCPLCGKRFRVQATLSAHQEAHASTRRRGSGRHRTAPPRPPQPPLPASASASPPTPLCCPACGQTFATQTELFRHQQTHPAADGAFKCHVWEKPFSCPQCGKSFIRRSTLKTHVLTHSARRPHACSYCHKSYASKNHLNRHVRTHKTSCPPPDPQDLVPTS